MVGSCFVRPYLAHLIGCVDDLAGMRNAKLKPRDGPMEAKVDLLHVAFISYHVRCNKCYCTIIVDLISLQ